MFEKFHRLLASDRQTHVIIAVAFLGLALQMLLWHFEMRYWQLSGDERYYFGGARQIHAGFMENLAGDHSTIRLRIHKIVSNGWYLPGMSLLLQPALHFGWELPQTRLYLILINFTLTLLIALRLAKCLPAPAALLWLTIMLLFPSIVLFSSTLWGESIAGKLYLLLLIELYHALQRNETKQQLSLPVLTGLALGVIIYIRPNFIIVSPLIVFAVFYHRWLSGNVAQALASATRFGLVAAVTTCITLLPWQFVTYQKFGTFFLTTTSVDLNAIVAYTDKTYESERPTNHGIFMRSHEQINAEIEAQAIATGESYGVALQKERSRILGKLTLDRYITVTKSSLYDFFYDVNIFFHRFQSSPGHRVIKKYLYRVLFPLNNTMWFGLFASTLLLFFVPRQLPPIGRWLSVCVKGSLLLLWVQPFMSLSSGRYVVAFIPLMALLVGIYASYDYQQRRASCKQAS